MEHQPTQIPFTNHYKEKLKINNRILSPIITILHQPPVNMFFVSIHKSLYYIILSHKEGSQMKIIYTYNFKPVVIKVNLAI